MGNIHCFNKLQKENSKPCKKSETQQLVADTYACKICQTKTELTTVPSFHFVFDEEIQEILLSSIPCSQTLDLSFIYKIIIDYLYFLNTDDSYLYIRPLMKRDTFCMCWLLNDPFGERRSLNARKQLRSPKEPNNRFHIILTGDSSIFAQYKNHKYQRLLPNMFNSMSYCINFKYKHNCTNNCNNIDFNVECSLWNGIRDGYYYNKYEIIDEYFYKVIVLCFEINDKKTLNYCKHFREKINNNCKQFDHKMNVFILCGYNLQYCYCNQCRLDINQCQCVLCSYCYFCKHRNRIEKKIGIEKVVETDSTSINTNTNTSGDAVNSDHYNCDDNHMHSNNSVTKKNGKPFLNSTKPQREVSSLEAIELAKEWDCPYVEISGKKCRKWQQSDKQYCLYIDQLYTRLNQTLIEQSIFHYWYVHRKYFQCPQVVDQTS